MNSVRAMCLGALVGVLAAQVSACGGTRQTRCLVSNCSGCCDETLGCLPGNEQTACGVGAVSCQSCSEGQACIAGVCRIPGASTDGGSLCTPETCSGCCGSDGTCYAGNLLAACGTGGGSCATCSQGQSCLSGSCTSDSCTGCLDAVGNCLQGNTSLACGSDGGVCVACSFDQTCENGACVGGGCNATNCADGCCSGDECVRGQPNDTQCGQGGAQCVGCQSPSMCQADGLCSDAGVDDGGNNINFPTDGGFPSTCGPGSFDPCTNGCCGSPLGFPIGLPICLEPGNPLAFGQCGLNGAACQACGAGKTCIAGMCI